MIEWHRKKTWTKDDEKEFFLRLARAREYNRPQYLYIKADSLVETENKKLLDVAEFLINELFTDYPNEKLTKPRCLNLMAKIFMLRGNNEKAIEYYKQAIDFEIVYPNVKTQAYLDHAELAIKLNKIELFDNVQENILIRLPTQLFSIEKYKSYSILCIINRQKGNDDLANQYSILAEENANKKTSGLRYHSQLGVVKQRGWLHKLVMRGK